MNGPLHGLRVLDLTRVLAGPLCTQLLGDLGADVIKVERPDIGDEARHFAPPYLRDEHGEESTESAYFAGTNRNKRSLTINLDHGEGQHLVRRLLAGCDVLVENFKTGTLAKRGLGYDQLKTDFPRLIYCSITGFGQTGPYAERPGYDSLIQAMGGIMSLTGEPNGEPMKVGVPIADIMAGMYAAVAVLAAVRHRQANGQGQFIDVGMLDTQVAWLSNQGMNYLATGKNPERLGNQHPNILPYQVVPTADGHIMVTIGNDAAFKRFCETSGCEHLLQDQRFNTNAARVRHRSLVTETLNGIFQTKPAGYWLEQLERVKIGCGPINTLEQVFADPHVSAREMVLEMNHPATGDAPVKLIASPINLSETPVTYRRSPPMLGEHTEDVLREELAMSEEEIAGLKEQGVV
jgi:crotonobetainyl-CoA:carnitine CoA-transferase CaiB-like acyl-CoA transferase